ncbi:TetR/AcrR family transcriptional regulator [Kribbella sancticallisti]|uniref:TetR/AcrR family transcriptional regulator n=1 Tax=Kribbella sancticallisti TaxID=460087 RepID=A0ABP4Q857_9ACTN
MSEISETRTRRRRADAERSRSAILAAAVEVLSEEPDAGLERVATAAGITRQTVYAHFPSRDALLVAIADRLTAEVLAAYGEPDLESGSAIDALVRLIDTGRRFAEHYPVRLYPAAATGDEERHEPVADLLTRIVRHGQTTGEFTQELPVGWLVTCVVTLGHAAADLPARKAKATLHTTLRRLLTGQQ